MEIKFPFYPTEPGVRTFLFGRAECNSRLLNTDKVLIAFEGSLEVVGAAVVRDGNLIFLYGENEQIKTALKKEVKKLS